MEIVPQKEAFWYYIASSLVCLISIYNAGLHDKVSYKVY